MSNVSRLQDALRPYNTTKMSLVVDGIPIKYMSSFKDPNTHQTVSRRNQVYVRTTGELIYRYKDRDIEIEHPDVFITDQVTLSLRFCIPIAEKLGIDQQNYRIVVKSELNLVCIYTEKYDYCRKYIEEHDKIFEVNGNIPTPEEANTLRSNFQLHVLRAHKEIIYRKQSSALKVFTRYNEIYRKFGIYVPVFVECPDVIPTLIEAFPFLAQTKLYQKAVEMNRIISRNEISGYMLTQLEVCKALGLTQMVRFTPIDIYELFIGEAITSATSYPSDRQYEMVAMGNSNLFRSRLSIQRYNELVAQSQGNDEALAILNKYARITTRNAYCLNMAIALRGVMLPFDDPKAVEAGNLYSIIKRISLY